MIVRQGRNHPTQHDQRNITAAESDQHRKTQSTGRIPGADSGPHLKKNGRAISSTYRATNTTATHARRARVEFWSGDALRGTAELLFPVEFVFAWAFIKNIAALRWRESLCTELERFPESLHPVLVHSRHPTAHASALK